MKNVNGLRDAMVLIESACDEGEITIIGHGTMPSAPEMLVKCAEFLVKTMGADVDLIAVVNDALVRYNNGEGKSCSCGCPACCASEDEESEPTLHYDCSHGEMESAVCHKIADYFGFCTDEVKAEIRDITMKVVDGLIGIIEDEYRRSVVCISISEGIFDAYGGLDSDHIEEYADDIVELIEDYISWE